MKGLIKLICCFVFVLGTTAYSGSLMLTASNLGNGQVAIGYEVTSGSDVPVGLALNATLTNGATFSGATAASSYFPIYPGTINIDPTGIVTDYGSPVAPSNHPGALGGIGTSGMTLEMATQLSPQETGFDPYDARDINRDGYIDYMDMAILVANWTSEGSAGDITGDLRVDMRDLSGFVGGMDPNMPQLDKSQLLVLQIDLHGALSTTLLITPETTYRGGIVDGYGNAFTVTPASIVTPEPATLVLLGLGGVMLRKFKSKN